MILYITQGLKNILRHFYIKNLGANRENRLQVFSYHKETWKYIRHILYWIYSPIRKCFHNRTAFYILGKASSFLGIAFVAKMPVIAVVFARITQCSYWVLHMYWWMKEPHQTCDILWTLYQAPLFRSARTWSIHRILISPFTAVGHNKLVCECERAAVERLGLVYQDHNETDCIEWKAAWSSAFAQHSTSNNLEG